MTPKSARMEEFWVPFSLTHSVMLVKNFFLCISMLILLHWIGKKNL